MNNTWFDISSLGWWIGVVLVGLAINLASAYLRSPFDSLLSAISKRWSTRTEVQRKMRAERIAILRASKEEQAFALLEALHIRVRSLLMILIGWIVLAMSTMLKHDVSSGHVAVGILILKYISLGPIIFGMNDWTDVIRRRGEIYDARKPAI
jgi:hypothetical protein